MPKVKDAGEIAKKWARVTPQRSEDYIQGVQNPRTDWEAATKAAESNYESGVQGAIRDKRFGKGVAGAGTDKWQSKTVDKGGQRWGPGVQGAEGDYEEGFKPFREVIAGTTLPPRYPKGDPRNIERVRTMAAALRKKKTG